jgi:hypothetical protein
VARDKPDWEKIKKEYLEHKTPYRKLAEKYNVSFSTLKERARREEWAKHAKMTQQKVRNKLTQKIATKKANVLFKEIDPALEAVNMINQLVLDTLKDTKQFKRHLIQRRERGLGVSANGDDVITERWWVEEQEFDVVDAKRLKDLAAALKISKELQRLLEGLVDPGTEKKLDIEREKLEIDKKKAGDPGDSKDIKIVLEGELEEWGR